MSILSVLLAELDTRRKSDPDSSHAVSDMSIVDASGVVAQGQGTSRATSSVSQAVSAYGAGSSVNASPALTGNVSGDLSWALSEAPPRHSQQIIPDRSSSTPTIDRDGRPIILYYFPVTPAVNPTTNPEYSGIGQLRSTRRSDGKAGIIIERRLAQDRRENSQAAQDVNQLTTWPGEKEPRIVTREVLSNGRRETIPRAISRLLHGRDEMDSVKVAVVAWTPPREDVAGEIQRAIPGRKLWMVADCTALQTEVDERYPSDMHSNPSVHGSNPRYAPLAPIALLTGYQAIIVPQSLVGTMEEAFRGPIAYAEAQGIDPASIYPLIGSDRRPRIRVVPDLYKSSVVTHPARYGAERLAVTDNAINQIYGEPFKGASVEPSRGIGHEQSLQGHQFERSAAPQHSAPAGIA